MEDKYKFAVVLDNSSLSISHPVPQTYLFENLLKKKKKITLLSSNSKSGLDVLVIKKICKHIKGHIKVILSYKDKTEVFCKFQKNVFYMHPTFSP